MIIKIIIALALVYGPTMLFIWLWKKISPKSYNEQQRVFYQNDITNSDSGQKISNIEYFKGIFYIFVIPGLIYLLIKWDPILGHDEFGEPTSTLGFLLVLILYWVALLLILKHKTENKKLKWQIERLLDESMDSAEKARLKEELKNESHNF